MTYVLGLLRLEVSPRFMEIFGSDGDLYDNMLNISYYKNQVVPRLRCYGFSTPGCTPSPTADDEVRMHFHNNSFGIYNDHIMNYYIKYDGISSFGSHLGRVQCFDSNFTSANVYNFHLIQNFYYFLPMADQLPA